MNDNDRVADRRIDISLPLVEGGEEVPDLTSDILARLRAEGMLPHRRRRTWVAAALLLLGIGVALGVALQGLVETEEVAVAGTDGVGEVVPEGTDEVGEVASAGTDQVGSSPSLPTGQPPLASVLPGQDPVRGTRRVEPPRSEPQASGGNTWFTATDLDLGTVYYREGATGTFSFQNPTGGTVGLKDFTQSCTCTRATFRVGDEEYYLEATTGSRFTPSGHQLYHVVERNGVRNPERVSTIPVAPGEEGTVEVEMELSGVKGPKSANIGFSTTDPDLPFVRLTFQATGATYFSIEPAEIELGTMLWNERVEFTAKVTSPVLGDFNILRHDTPPEGMEVDYKKNMLDGRAEYAITGTYGPAAADGNNGGRLVFHTEYEGLSFDLRVLAVVEGPLRVTPNGFLALGRIRAGNAASRSVTLETTDGTELGIEKLEARELSFDEKFLELSTEKKEKTQEITLRILPGVASGTVVRGEILVHLDHPGAKTTTILFNGFVR